jgi:Uma2 family endonuclease
VVFGSNTGFVFGEKLVLKVSPDEALIERTRFEALSDVDQEKLVPIAPDIAVGSLTVHDTSLSRLRVRPRADR